MVQQNSKANQHHFAGFDFVLAAAAVAAIAWLQFRAPVTNLARQNLCLSIPLVYLLVTKLFAATPLEVAARRVYLLCFFTGLISSGLAFQLFMENLSAELANTEFEFDRLLNQIFIGVPNAAQHFLTPMLTGVAVYIVCSVFDTDEIGKQVPSFDFTNLERWLEASDAPSAVKEMLQQGKVQVTQLHTAYRKLAERSEAARAEIEATGTAAQNTRQAFSELAATSSHLNRDLTEFRRELLAARAQVDQLQAAVHESQQVVDEFADIASRNILK